MMLVLRRSRLLIVFVALGGLDCRLLLLDLGLVRYRGMVLEDIREEMGESIRVLTG